jgi:hypothetical protein
MPAFIDECRYEWKRLGVPDSMAEEMAAELEADLAEAEADGVSAAEILGESDPRRFAANWAHERGLVSVPPPKKSRKGLWIGLAVGLILLLLIALPALALISVGSGSISTVRSPKPVRSLVIPNFVGLKACHAKRIARESGLEVHPFPRSRCNAVVVAQRPVRGTLVEWRRGRPHTTVTLRLRG